jgi:superfamily II DNA or RNA helicase
MSEIWTRWFPEQAVARSISYVRDQRVGVIVERDGNLDAMVVGGDDYEVKLRLDRPRLLNQRLHVAGLTGSCTCPVEGACKHMAAVLRQYEADLQAVPPAAPAAARRAEKMASARPAAEAPPPERYEACGQDDGDQAVLRLLNSATAVPAPRAKPSSQVLLYVLDRAGLARIALRLASARRLKDGTWRDVRVKDDPLNLLARPPAYLTDEDRQLVGSLVGANQRRDDEYTVMELIGAPAAAALIDRMLATGRLVFSERADTWGYLEQVRALRAGQPQSATPAWSRTSDHRWRLSLGGSDGLAVLACDPPRCLVDGTIAPLAIADQPQRLAHAAGLPPLDDALACVAARVLGIAPPAVQEPVAVPCVPIARLWRTQVESSYIRRGGRYLTIEVATLSFRYGDRVVRASDVGMRAGADGPLRDPEAEARALGVLAGCGLLRLERWNAYPWRLPQRPAQERVHHSLAPRLPTSGTLPVDDHTPLPATGLAALVQGGWRVERPDGSTMERAIIDGAELVAEVGEGDAGDWFQLHLGIEVDGRRVDLAPALAPLVAGGDAAFIALERHAADGAQVLLPLGDGRLVRLPAERLRRLVRFIASLFAGGPAGLGITPDALLAADDLADVLPRWLGADRLRALADRLRPLLKPGAVDPPPGFVGTLRAYQRQGLAWLQRLREAGAGGLLADDMGLGKTVQVLAHLALEHAAGRGGEPALVVAPASVAANWVREARRFAPMLRALLHHGQDRHGLDPGAHDLVVTTYGTLLRDQESLARQQWSTLICDEAQFLKNANAKAAQAVRGIKARSRLSLTGTPVENHLGELWAQLHWLNPGLLGSRKAFDQAFRTPIEKHGDGARLDLLQRRIAPFLLRRTKALVATDLPAKTSSVLAVRLEGAQRDLYEAVRTAMDSRLAEALKAKGLGRSRIEVLDALLKLRQCCCDPRLVKAKGTRAVRESAKLDALADLLPTLIEDGRRVLIFSQFTAMLALIDARLEQAGIARVRLTGDTPVPARQALVDRFQRGEVPVFLISLKAGGTGLNLTSADTVVLYDPWWNPAVEDQAIDRAHRIGQDKPVFVYRLVAQGTVEERMLDLQARKRALADALYGDEERVAGDLTEADLAALLAPITG